MTKSQPFPVTPELLDSLTDPDAEWPQDPAVPELPPLPVTDDPGLDPDSFLTSHFVESAHSPKVAGPPPPLTALVSEENPLRNPIGWSNREPGRPASRLKRLDVVLVAWKLSEDCRSEESTRDTVSATNCVTWYVSLSVRV